MKPSFKYSLVIVLTLLALTFGALGVPPVQAAGLVVLVDNLQPSWTAPGAGGVWSSYSGPPAYTMVSPGVTALYDGREAGIIKAGLDVDPTSGHYEDDGIFGFMPAVTINVFASEPLTYDVQNQEGTNPVWMTIEIDTGLAGDRSDNTVYQHVPTTNPAGWHTVDAALGLWQQWADNQGTPTGELKPLNDVVTAHDGLNVVRAYLRLGMGDSYHGTGAGTLAWVDQATLAGVTYDFVVPSYWYVATTGLDTNEGSLASPFLTIQHAVDSAGSGDTIHVAAGSYTEVGQIVIDKDLSLVGEGMTTTVIMPDGDTGSSNDGKGWFLVNSGMTFNMSYVTLDGTGRKVYQAIRHHGSGVIDHVKFTNIKYEESGPAYNGVGVEVITTGSIDVTNSEFSEMGRYGVQVWDGGGTATGTYSGNTYTGKGDGNWLDYAFEIGWGAHITIQNNVVTGNTGVALSDGSGSSAISVWDDPDTQAVIAGNTLTGNTAGIAIAVINGGGIDPVVTVGAGNTFTNNDTAIDVQSVGAFGSPTLSVTGSTFSGNDTGLAVVPGMTADNIEAHLNAFTGSTTGVANSGTGSLDAENNWWNSITGPTHASNAAGSGDASSDNVDFRPWCTDATCTAFVPPFATNTTITVDDPDPSAIDETVTVTATVAGVLTGAPTPTGTVTVSGGAADCTITLVSGTGSCDITFTTGGAQTITATYNPGSTDFSISSDTESHAVEEGTGVDVGVGSNTGNYVLSANETVVSNYPGVMDGPVHVQDMEPGFILASQRVTSGNSYNEVMGIPTSQLTNEYWFPYYNHGYPSVSGSSMRTWILIGNPDDLATAEVDVFIGGNLMGHYSILPGSRVTPRWPGLQDGPVHVLSDIPVFASERVFTVPNNSFNETFGYPADQFTTEYWFPWYDSVSMNASILVGNTSAAETAEVDIYIGPNLMDSYEIAANDTLIQSYPATMDGPVRVVVTNGIDIVASESALSGPVGNRGNYNEVIGYPFDQFDIEYFFPYYDHGYPVVSGSNMRTWILVGNPDDTLTADVDIYIDGAFMGNFSVLPNSRVTPRWIGLQGGPVQVVSDIPVFVSERVLTSPSNAFNEMMGYPASQLANEYWFPWYDSINMSNDILITRP